MLAKIRHQVVSPLTDGIDLFTWQLLAFIAPLTSLFSSSYCRQYKRFPTNSKRLPLEATSLSLSLSPSVHSCSFSTINFNKTNHGLEDNVEWTIAILADDQHTADIHFDNSSIHLQYSKRYKIIKRSYFRKTSTNTTLFRSIGRHGTGQTCRSFSNIRTVF
ncbi:hypothetical protein T11_11275 [Trichinella zimbabwensis]|uniref:Uncharacterized protein n=1 Tax=Trichinella zimbabwensis TaxID=268475 RepID=A0A0V1HHG9_9BILA|nr:hypothetical protein T11_11275 [Trichinella zimbabwensis]